MAANVNLNINAHDRASGKLRGVSGALGNIGQIAAGILAAGIFRKIAQGITDMGRQAIAATAQIQMMTIGVETLLARELRQADGQLKMNEAMKTAQPLAAKYMEELAQMAILSPYQLEQVNTTFRQAMAFGFASDEAMAFTGAILNTAAGVGATNDMMSRMAYNLAQVRLQGKVTALDIRQLALAGFDLRTVLHDIAEEHGYNIDTHLEFNKLIEQGKIKWEDFAKGFEKYAEENFEGASERLSRSLFGLKSTFKDVFQLTMPKVLGPAADVATAYLNNILDGFLDLRESGVLEALGEDFAEFTRTSLGAIDSLRDFVTGGDWSVLYEQQDRVRLWWTTYGPAIKTMATETFENVRTQIGGLIEDRIIPFFLEELDKMHTWFFDNGPLILDVLENISDWFNNVIVPAVVEAWDGMEIYLDYFSTSLGKWGTAVLEAANGDWAAAWKTVETMPGDALDAIDKTILEWKPATNLVIAMDEMQLTLDEKLAGMEELWREHLMIDIMLDLWQFQTNMKTAFFIGMSLAKGIIAAKLIEWEALFNSWKINTGVIIAGGMLSFREKMRSGFTLAGVDVGAGITTILDLFEKFAEAAQKAGKRIGEKFGQAVVGAIRSYISAIERAVADALKALAALAGLSLGGGGGGYVDITDGGGIQKQFGGTVRPGEPVWVGEAGRPELFVPDSYGRIYNDRQMTNGNGKSRGTINVNVAYSPLLSTADEYEIVNKLAPFIRKVIHESKGEV